MCVAAVQISYSLENASFFSLLNHLVPSFSFLSILSHACRHLLSLPMIPDLLSRPPPSSLALLSRPPPSSLALPNSSRSRWPPSIPARRLVNMASPSSWICVAPSGTASNLFWRSCRSRFPPASTLLSLLNQTTFGRSRGLTSAAPNLNLR